MNSKRAEGLLNSRRRINDQDTQYYYDDVVDIIEVAEEDAEKRVLKTVAEWLKKIYHDYAVDEQFIPEIKNLLNNEEESNERKIK